jgi:hypothetical protein
VQAVHTGTGKLGDPAGTVHRDTESGRRLFPQRFGRDGNANCESGHRDNCDELFHTNHSNGENAAVKTQTKQKYDCGNDEQSAPAEMRLIKRTVFYTSFDSFFHGICFVF